MSKMSEIHADAQRADWLNYQANLALSQQNIPEPSRFVRFRSIKPRTKLKPLAARLLAVSNGLSLRVDTLRKVRGKT